MLIRTLIALILVGIVSLHEIATYGASEPCQDPTDTSYQCYTKNVKYYCGEYKDTLWNTDNFLLKDKGITSAGGAQETKYSELSAEGLIAGKAYLRSSVIVPTSGASMEKSPTDTLYALEFLQMGHDIYHKDMNRIFACAVVSSRINITKKMTDIINKRFGNVTSEVIHRINEQQKRLIATSESLMCNGVDSENNTQTPVPMRLRLLDSATYQYCTYRYYLDYLQRNVNNDFGKLQSEVKKYRDSVGEKGEDIATTVEFAKFVENTNIDIAKEIDLAKRTYPIALTAFVEMERTYSTHIILQFIYDDYVEMRKNLRDFLNPLSQLFYKVLNAQSANR